MLLIHIYLSVLEDEGHHDLWASFVFVPDCLIFIVTFVYFSA